MINTGLVRVNLCLTTKCISTLVASAGVTSQRLYVALRGDWSKLSLTGAQARLQFVYQQVARSKPELDVRVLLPTADYEAAPGASDIDALLGEAEAEADLPALNSARGALGLPTLTFVPLSPPAASALAHTLAAPPPAASGAAPLVTYEHVCMGGTFDFMHTGHKLLLSLGALSCSRRLVCGVSDAPLLKKKSLRELMQPIETRIAVVDDFLSSVRPGLSYELPPLQDGFGPAITDGSLQSIVVSEETVKGGHMCNEKRAAAVPPLAPLAIVSVGLVDADGSQTEGVGEEQKVSSSGVRRSQLGKLRGAPAAEAHWRRKTAAGSPYVIGLTGGVASGKTRARTLLEASLGARIATVDCDELVHRSCRRRPLCTRGGLIEAGSCRRALMPSRYQPGTRTHSALVEAFGERILASPATAVPPGYASPGAPPPRAAESPVAESPVDRQALGALVFAGGGGAALQTLNSIVRPAAAELVAREARGCEAVVLEAAMLLEAGWDAMVDGGHFEPRHAATPVLRAAGTCPQVDEVWTVVAPHAAVVERLCSRDGLAEADAEARVSRQMGVSERLARSHVPLSSAEGQDLAAQLQLAYEGAMSRAAGPAPATPAVPPALASDFSRAAERAGLSAEASRRWWHALRDAYSSPSRHYHTLAHLEEMRARAAALEARGLVESALLLALATFFHDYVYNARESDNEARSADVFTRFAQDATRLSAAEVETVTRWIERTAAHHAGAASGDLGRFLDIDLAVLGKPGPAYARYAAQIRLEYAHVPPAEFVRGRAAVLAKFEGAGSLFFSDEMREELEERARSNVGAERARLAKRAYLFPPPEGIASPAGKPPPGGENISPAGTSQ